MLAFRRNQFGISCLRNTSFVNRLAWHWDRRPPSRHCVYVCVQNKKARSAEMGGEERSLVPKLEMSSTSLSPSRDFSLQFCILEEMHKGNIGDFQKNQENIWSCMCHNSNAKTLGQHGKQCDTNIYEAQSHAHARIQQCRNTKTTLLKHQTILLRTSSSAHVTDSEAQIRTSLGCL